MLEIVNLMMLGLAWDWQLSQAIDKSKNLCFFQRLRTYLSMSNFNVAVKTLEFRWVE